MWADVWEAARQETDAFSGTYEHSCHTHTHLLCPTHNNCLWALTLSALSMCPSDTFCFILRLLQTSNSNFSFYEIYDKNERFTPINLPHSSFVILLYRKMLHKQIPKKWSLSSVNPLSHSSPFYLHLSGLKSLKSFSTLFDSKTQIFYINLFPHFTEVMVYTLSEILKPDSLILWLHHSVKWKYSRYMVLYCRHSNQLYSCNTFYSHMKHFGLHASRCKIKTTQTRIKS